MVPRVISVFANIRNTDMVDQLNLLESSWEFFVFFIFVLKYKSNTSPYWKIWKSYNIKKRKIATIDNLLNKDKLAEILVDLPPYLCVFIVKNET